MTPDQVIAKLGEIVTDKIANLQGELDAYEDLFGKGAPSEGQIKRARDKEYDASSYQQWEYQRGYTYGLENARHWIEKFKDL